MTSKANAFKGFELYFNNLRMWWQMTWRLFLFIVLIHLITVSIITYCNFRDVCGGSRSSECTLKGYIKSSIFNMVDFSLQGKVITYKCDKTIYTVNSRTFVNDNKRYADQILLVAKSNILKILIYTSPVYLLYLAFVIYFYIRSVISNKDKHIRGGKIVSAAKLLRLMSHSHRSLIKCLTISIPYIDIRGYLKGSRFSSFTGYRFIISDNLYIPESIVTRHTFIIGRPGSGKSQLLYRLLEQIIKNDYKCIVHDFKGDFINNFYDPQKHLIFNPLDTRHVKWNLFNELKDIQDIDAFCASLIPESGSQDVFWPISARSVLNSILTYCYSKGKTTYEELWYHVNLSNEELLPLLESVDGCKEGIKLLTEAKTANNIMAVLSNYTKIFKYLIGTDGDFSITNWVKDDTSKHRIIFLSNYAMIQESIKPFLTLFIDFASKTLCSMDDSIARRLYLVMDEFGQLGKIGSIIQFLTQSRSKGGAGVISIQDIAQLNTLYTQDGAKSIVNSCGNTISFAVADESTADFISKSIGSSEMIRTEESVSMGVSDLRDSVSHSKRVQEVRLVLPSEIMNLPTMNYYCKLSDLPVAKDSFNFRKFKKLNQSFIQREDLSLHSIRKKSESVLESDNTISKNHDEFSPESEMPDHKGKSGPHIDEQMFSEMADLFGADLDELANISLKGDADV
ncbi:MAG: type IV secretion system DNA-binding domain-containing protein [Fibrobacter sp.]|nr:type IV secretion system DNA-binding domain-containing protein [Fibrobacter sp.]